jgi:membrane protease YdiL (CAAX protease family)
MNHYDLQWQTSDLIVFLPIILSTCCFSLFWFVSKSEKIKQSYYLKYNKNEASAKHILFTKYFGFFSMGIVAPVVLMLFLPKYSFAQIGLTFYKETALETLYWIVGLSLVTIPIVYFSAKKPKNLVNYPQIRATVWTKKLMIQNALGWAAYLFGYELLFRGVLLFPLADELGIWSAIAINVALYSATHIPKGLDETIGAAPLGLVLCLLTLSTGTIWIAFIVHVFMAWTNSFTALHFHPDMKKV